MFDSVEAGIEPRPLRAKAMQLGLLLPLPNILLSGSMFSRDALLVTLGVHRFSKTIE